MEVQDTKIKYKSVLALLLLILLGVLVVFFIDHSQAADKIDFLQQEKQLLTRDLTLVKAEVDRLSALNEVNEIELQDSRYRIDQLLDSVGRLNFTIAKLKEYKRELKTLEGLTQSLQQENTSLAQGNKKLQQKYDSSRSRESELREITSDLAATEALLQEQNKRLSQELRRKSYLALQHPEGSGFRLRSNGNPTKTNKATTVERLRGCVTVMANPNLAQETKTLYLQFLDPNMRVIGDQGQILNINGNIYSKEVSFLFDGGEMGLCDAISVASGSLTAGTYTLNVFEAEKLLATTEFQLK